MNITKVGVVGCGLMGAGIAEVCARAGLDVVVAESTESAASMGQDRLHTSLKRAEAKGRIDSAEAVLARIRVVAELQEFADRQLVVEAIVEDEAAKVGSPRSPQSRHRPSRRYAHWNGSTAARTSSCAARPGPARRSSWKPSVSRPSRPG